MEPYETMERANVDQVAVGQRCNPWPSIPPGDQKLPNAPSADVISPGRLVEIEFDWKTTNRPPQEHGLHQWPTAG